MSEEVKSPVASKTMWVNMLAIVGVVAAGLSDKLDAASPEQITGGFVVMAVVNLVLRAVTKSPLIFKKK